jgi:hypothetical protein
MEIVPDYKLDPPDYPDPPTVYICDGCKQSIRDGDDYYEFGCMRYCQDCIDKRRRTAEAWREDW